MVAFTWLEGLDFGLFGRKLVVFNRFEKKIVRFQARKNNRHYFPFVFKLNAVLFVVAL